MHEEQITQVAKAFEEWNPLGDAAKAGDELDGYRFEAIDIVSTIALLGSGSDFTDASYLNRLVRNAG